MASTLQLVETNAGGTTTVTLTTKNIFSTAGYVSMPRGVDLGSAEDRPRRQKWPVWLKGSSMDDALQKLNQLERFLTNVRVARANGLGRTLQLQYTPNGATVQTIWDILGGQVVDRPPATSRLLIAQNVYGPFALDLEVECERAVDVLRDQEPAGRWRPVNDLAAENVPNRLDRRAVWRVLELQRPPEAVCPRNPDVRQEALELVELLQRVVHRRALEPDRPLLPSRAVFGTAEVHAARHADVAGGREDVLGRQRDGRRPAGVGLDKLQRAGHR